MRAGLALAFLLAASGCGEPRETSGEAPANEADGAAQSGWAEDAAFSLQREGEAATVEIAAPRATLARDRALYERVYVASAEEAAAFERMAGQAKAELERGDYPFRPYDLAIDWSAAFENGRVASLLKAHWEYTGGAHGNVFYETVTWSFDDSRPLGPADLFRDQPETWAALSEAARAALIAAKAERLGEEAGQSWDFWREGIEDATAAEPRAFEAMTLEPSDEPGKAGGIRLYYPPYVAGSYAEGAYETVIPQEAFAAHVDPDFAWLFAGEPASPSGD